MKKILKYTGILAITAFLGLSLTSCKEDLPKAVVHPYATELNSIKIVNAGPNHDKVVEGTIDKEKREIMFPRISKHSDFGALRFEGDMSEGAHFEFETYDFSMPEDITEKKQVVKVKNHNRYTEYIVQVGKIAPLKGADFSKAVVHKFTPEGFSSFRWADFDGKYALFTGVGKAVMAKVSDLVQDKFEPTELSMEGVSGGTLSTSCGQLANGHAYLASLGGGLASTLKIYYYETPESKPEVVFESVVKDMPGTTNRYGDNMGLDLDAKGNGFIFFAENPGRNVLRLTVKEYKTIGSPVVLNADMSGAYYYDTITRADGTDNYFHGGSALKCRLVSEDMTTEYTFPSYFYSEFNSARIINFNKERYLLGVTVGRSPSVISTLYAFNITNGANLKDAFDKFFATDNEEGRKPLFEQSIGGSTTGNARSNSGYGIEFDEKGRESKLYLFGSRWSAGFVVAEIPVKRLAESEE